jgi:cytochrome oxidase Cu insertion factor (SCO1/SenC/PrrC family)
MGGLNPTRHTFRPSSIGYLVGLIAAFSLVAAACGGDDGGLAVGDAAPDFTLTDASGASVVLDAYQNQDVLLYFHVADG